MKRIIVVIAAILALFAVGCGGYRDESIVHLWHTVPTDDRSTVDSSTVDYVILGNGVYVQKSAGTVESSAGEWKREGDIVTMRMTSAPMWADTVEVGSPITSVLQLSSDGERLEGTWTDLEGNGGSVVLYRDN